GCRPPRPDGAPAGAAARVAVDAARVGAGGPLQSRLLVPVRHRVLSPARDCGPRGTDSRPAARDLPPPRRVEVDVAVRADGRRVRALRGRVLRRGRPPGGAPAVRAPGTRELLPAGGTELLRRGRLAAGAAARLAGAGPLAP